MNKVHTPEPGTIKQDLSPDEFEITTEDLSLIAGGTGGWIHGGHRSDPTPPPSGTV